MFLLFFANLITFEFASSKAGGVTCNKNRRNLNKNIASETTEYGITKSALAKACWISAQWWRPCSCGKRNGAFFRLVKCTTSRPPWQAATGGTRHGEAYQGSRASARP